MSDYVLDASAVLVLLNQEPGSEVVEEALSGEATVMNAVNYTEVVSKLASVGMPPKTIADALEPLGLTIQHHDRAVAEQAGLLYPATHRQGLSLGDRSCLALAKSLKLPALTADKAWVGLDIGVKVKLVR